MLQIGKWRYILHSELYFLGKYKSYVPLQLLGLDSVVNKVYFFTVVLNSVPMAHEHVYAPNILNNIFSQFITEFTGVHLQSCYQEEVAQLINLWTP